jgi:hypothetical protein
MDIAWAQTVYQLGPDEALLMTGRFPSCRLANETPQTEVVPFASIAGESWPEEYGHLPPAIATAWTSRPPWPAGSQLPREPPHSHSRGSRGCGVSRLFEDDHGHLPAIHCPPPLEGRAMNFKGLSARAAATIRSGRRYLPRICGALRCDHPPNGG